jgi:cell wall-associated NlpC family hydrolase
MENIQSTLNLLASQSDPRTSVFDIEIVRLQNSSLTLSGRLLDDSQLETLSRHFAKWKLDTSSIRILHKGNMPRMHVATNLTGLYEKPTFEMPLASELYYGTELEILEEQGQWVFTRQGDGYLGWAYKPYLTSDSSAEATHLVLAPSCELRTQPDLDGEIITRLVSGTGVCVEEQQAAWTKVTAHKTGWLPSAMLRAIRGLPDSLEERQKALLEDSARMIGVPYLWGGASGNGIDCSGLTRLLYRWVGVEIPRDADMQHEAAKPVEPPFEIGDLLFFTNSDSTRKITHVGMSLGGWKIVHSSRVNNGVYIEDVQARESLKHIFVSAGTFVR